jgi:hypothetical protein
MLLTLVNGLLGAVCGLIFRVQILVPLIAFACVESLLLKQAVFWYAMLLIVAIEVGYLVGAAAVALWLPSGATKTADDLPAASHNRSWSR